LGTIKFGAVIFSDEPSTKTSVLSSPPSSLMRLIKVEGLDDRLREAAAGPRTTGVNVLMRTQFCLLWPLRALGLPFRALGFADMLSLFESHWNGLPLLLRAEPRVESDGRRMGEVRLPALPEMSLRTLPFRRGTGEPLVETEV
jgi:hypothetical protein